MIFVLFSQVKFTKFFDLTDKNSANSKVDGEQLPAFESEWDAMPTTGTNCHQCLELIWESDIVPRCICAENKHKHDLNTNPHPYQANANQ